MMQLDDEMLGWLLIDWFDELPSCCYTSTTIIQRRKLLYKQDADDNLQEGVSSCAVACWLLMHEMEMACMIDRILRSLWFACIQQGCSSCIHQR